jgi:hypothetical protein
MQIAAMRGVRRCDVPATIRDVLPEDTDYTRALSHACRLVTYPLAGWLGAAAGAPATLVVLGLLTLSGAGSAMRLWPADDPDTIEHKHPDLDPGHPHIRVHDGAGRRHPHLHPYVIDNLHSVWPGLH